MNTNKNIPKSFAANLFYLAIVLLLSIPVGGYVYAFQEFPFQVQMEHVYRPNKTQLKVCSWRKAIQSTFADFTRIQLVYATTQELFNREVFIRLKNQQAVNCVACNMADRAFVRYFHSNVNDIPDSAHLV